MCIRISAATKTATNPAQTAGAKNVVVPNNDGRAAILVRGFTDILKKPGEYSVIFTDNGKPAAQEHGGNPGRTGFY